MSRYRRKRTRPPREAEKTEAMRRVDVLEARVRRYEQEILELNQRVGVAELEVEKLLHDKIAVAGDLLEARRTIELLTGRQERGIVHPERLAWSR